jgi:tRNA (mo5U34)-methyltransferase
MQDQETMAQATGTDDRTRAYLDQKFALFEREFDAEKAEKVSRLLKGTQAGEAVTYADIEAKYPHYAQLLVDDPTLEGRVERYLDKLQPFLQCPFPLPGRRVVQGAWVGYYKFNDHALCDMNPQTLANKRVLDVGCNAGFDTFYLSTMGAAEVIGIEPIPLFYYQALFLWSMYTCPNVRFLKTGWQGIKDGYLGSFDVINCLGIIYHEPHPMLLLETLFDLLAPGGKLVLESHVTMDDDMKAYFVEDRFGGDVSWYWVPSVPTLQAMMRSYGFQDIQVRSHYPVPTGNTADPTRTVEGHPAGGRAFLTATRPKERVHRPKFGWSKP